MSGRTAGRITDISPTHINNMANDMVVSPAMIRQFADGLKEPRGPLLEAAGFVPDDEDRAWDREHYGADQEPSETFLETLQRIGRVFPLSELPVAMGTLPLSPPEYRDGETFGFVEGAQGIFGVIAEGDSMRPYYEPGDLILARPISEVPRQGESYIVLIDNEVTCKLLESVAEEDGETWVTFAPANSCFPRVRVEGRRVRFQAIPITRVPRADLAAAAAVLRRNGEGG